MGSLVERLIAAITNKDVEAFGSLFAIDAVMYEPLLAEPARGKSAIVEGEASLFRAFSDISITVRNELTSDSTVMVEVVLSATNDGPMDLGTGDVPPTGRRVDVPMVWALDLNEQGLIIEERDYFDTSLIMAQLQLSE